MSSVDEQNPLLHYSGFPPFRSIKPEHFIPAAQTLIAKNRAALDEILQKNTHFSWENLLQPLEEMFDQFSRAWGLLSHLSAVVSSDELQKAYHEGIEFVSTYFSELSQNTALYEAMQQIAQTKEFTALSIAKQKVIKNELRDFKLAGVNLSPDKKLRYREISAELAKICHQFEENLLKATDAFTKIITDEALLAGLPETVKQQAKTKAREKNIEGYLFTLEAPVYQAIMTYADHRALREEFCYAYQTRASELGPAEFDNTAIMQRIVQLRHELAQLLEFNNFAEYSLATKMAKKTDQVLDFLETLGERAQPYARKEFIQLQEFARNEIKLNLLEPWDLAYSSEKLRQREYALSQEDLRPYFTEPKVIQGLFATVSRLFTIQFEEIMNPEVWHPDVRLFKVSKPDGNLLGYFYMDLYARAQKRAGAWVDDCLSRRELKDGTIQYPVVYLICNFPGPLGDHPALWNHDEVITLFHEFGHAMHHIVSDVDAAAVAGTHGVAWDAVELPSQFLENYCYEKEVLENISGHYVTGEPLPDDLIKKIKRAKNFQSGMQMMRQIVFSLFDFELHLRWTEHSNADFISQTLQRIRQRFTVEPIAPFNRFAHSFGHIFAGGYAAGYYSYKWAEVLSSDAYARFEEEGIFNPKTGREYYENIIRPGGSIDADELFRRFRGRDPDVTALLRHNGILEQG